MTARKKDNPIHNMPKLYADILLPIARDTFTFEVGESVADTIAEGVGVEVTLGARKRYMGIVWRLHTDRPPFKTIKTIDNIVMSEVLVSDTQRGFWEWVAEYYMCTLGEVMRAALPASLKPSGLSSEEFGYDKYKPRVIRHFALSETLKADGAAGECYESLRRAKVQQAALTELCGKLFEAADIDITYNADTGVIPCAVFAERVPRKELAASDATLRKLVERGYVYEIMAEHIDDSGVGDGSEAFELPKLSNAQRKAYDDIKSGFAVDKPVVLHGVTGSGKTEIYAHLIAETVSTGRSVLYLMPEIVMTSQIVRRIECVFGSRVTLYHSMLTDRRRADIYRRLSHGGGGEVVMGVRSSIFLPISNVGLVIVDEEHDRSYKQSDTAPRYSARDGAVVLAKLHGGAVILGSATPSIESFTNTLSGKYAIATLTGRYGDGKLPRVTVSDTMRSVKRGERKAHFNKELTDKLETALRNGRQAILFQNRRGYSPFVECEACGWIARCVQCNVTLTYHKHDNRLKCHWCGYSQPMLTTCPSCRKHQLRAGGFGTEKVDEELQRLYPDIRIARLDRDTATSPKRYGEIVDSFDRGDYDVLVGTQIVTKGLDFANVSLVGILNADNMLNYPDFRASERAYQLMTQVSGRAGRADAEGEVVIQTTQPDNPIIGYVRTSDYNAMVRDQLAERKIFKYPPYGRLINITLSHTDSELLARGADVLSAALRNLLGKRVFGPHPPVVDRISNVNMLDILVKCEPGTSLADIKYHIREQISLLGKNKEFRAIGMAVNVDPQ